MSHYSIDSHFPTRLGNEEIFVLIENGIKFFLFQRGQIPTPYERLRIADSSDENTAPTSNNTLDESTVHSDETSKDDVNSRLRTMKSQRRLMIQQMLLVKKDKRLYEMETNARMILDGVFLSLRSIFLSPYITNVTAVLLVFGSSIYHPKEVITFKIDPGLKAQDIELNNKEKTSNSSSSCGANIRSFCKAIIMSSEFLEFTDKSLRSTFTHMCLLTNQELTDSELKKELILMDDHHHLLHDPMSSNKHSHLKRKRSLLITQKLKIPSASTDQPDYLKPENVRSFCYQLPFRFKGIHVRSGHPS